MAKTIDKAIDKTIASGDATKVLIVDDEADLRVGLLSILKLRGFDVTSASSGEDALHLIREKNFDVVISDVTMPNGDGFWLLKKVREMGSSVPFILTTGNIEVSEINAKEAGAFALLRKPASASGHIHMINAALKAHKESVVQSV